MRVSIVERCAWRLIECGFSLPRGHWRLRRIHVPHLPANPNLEHFKNRPRICCPSCSVKAPTRNSPCPARDCPAYGFDLAELSLTSIVPRETEIPFVGADGQRAEIETASGQPVSRRTNPFCGDGTP